MNRLERSECLSAISESLPELSWEPLRALLASLDEFSQGGSWELLVSSLGPAQKIGVRYRGRAGDPPYSSWSVKAAHLLGLPEPGESLAPEGFPWLELLWDAAGQRPASACLPGGWESRPFSPRMTGHPELGEALTALHRLHPVRCAVFERYPSGKPGAWSLRFREPMPWPLFLALDLSAPFAPHASLLSFLLLNRRVSELKFSEGELWACAGK